MISKVLKIRYQWDSKISMEFQDSNETAMTFQDCCLKISLINPYQIIVTW